MARAAQIYKFTCTANGSDILLVSGGFYKVLSATGTIKISREGGSAIGPILPGQGERENFNRLTILDTTGAANTGYILIADASFEDTRVYGEVGVVDGGLARTMANAGFGGMVELAGSVGNYSHLQLFNPVANPRNLVVSRLLISSGSVDPVVLIRAYNGALTTLSGNPNPNSKKIIVGANSTAELRTQVNATLLGTGVNNAFYGLSKTPISIDFKEPMVLTPNTGLLVVNTVVNSHIMATFDFNEVTP